jgi:hypothetical protein
MCQLSLEINNSCSIPQRVIYVFPHYSMIFSVKLAEEYSTANKYDSVSKYYFFSRRINTVEFVFLLRGQYTQCMVQITQILSNFLHYKCVQQVYDGKVYRSVQTNLSRGYRILCEPHTPVMSLHKPGTPEIGKYKYDITYTSL